MPNRTMSCLNCGVQGEIEVPGLNTGKRSLKIFRHLGHNPFSNHRHYQCPACQIVLLVDPASVAVHGRISSIARLGM